MKIPKTIYSVKSNLLFVGGLVLFVIFFALVYTPGYELCRQLTSAVTQTTPFVPDATLQTLVLPVVCAVILAGTALSRTLLLLTTHTSRIHEGEYFLWQLGEVVTTALFIDLFLSLYLHTGYLEAIPPILLTYISIVFYPYAFYWLLVERIDRDTRIAEAQHTIVHLRQARDNDDRKTIRFVDDKGITKLVVSARHVICIEAAGNYVNILYTGGSDPVRYSLRNTLKGIEEPCADSASLVRCHRSYYINLNHVKLLRRSSGGIYAEMDHEKVDAIPVSRSYAADVMQQFAERK